MHSRLVVKGWHLPPFLIAVFLFAESAGANPIAPYMIFDGFSYSETTTIKSAVEGSTDGGFRSGERQWSSSWIEIGVRSKHWGVGFVKRYDYDLRFSQGAAEIYWLTENKQTLPLGNEYQFP